jgi:hypothetical protein
MYEGGVGAETRTLVAAHSFATAEPAVTATSEEPSNT